MALLAFGCDGGEANDDLGDDGSVAGSPAIVMFDAAQAAGVDSRGQQSAALLVVQRDAGYAQLSDSLVDLRIDDHERPLGELRRLYDLHREVFGRE